MANLAVGGAVLQQCEVARSFVRLLLHLLMQLGLLSCEEDLRSLAVPEVMPAAVGGFRPPLVLCRLLILLREGRV